jgi:hypothetical protein
LLAHRRWLRRNWPLHHDLQLLFSEEEMNDRENNPLGAIAVGGLILLACVVAIGCLAVKLAKPRTVCPDCPGGVCPLQSPVNAAAYSPQYAAEKPTVNLPYSLRQKNWGTGSCWHASLKSVMNWQHQYKLRDWWPYEGGEYADRGHRRLDAAGVKYTGTMAGDERILQWMLDTRRGAVITYWPAHAVTCVHLDDQWAGLLDNNRTNQVIWIPRREFIPNWRGYGGWATTLLYSPAPPIPRR